MPNKTNPANRLYAILPENLAALKKRATPSGNQGGGHPNVNLPLNSIICRWDRVCANALSRVWSSLPDERDRAFIRHVLMGIPTQGDDVTVADMPLSYLEAIAESAAEYEPGEEPFTAALLPALKRFGPLEAVALVDWIEQEKIKK